MISGYLEAAAQKKPNHLLLGLTLPTDGLKGLTVENVCSSFKQKLFLGIQPPTNIPLIQNDKCVSFSILSVC